MSPRTRRALNVVLVTLGAFIGAFAAGWPWTYSLGFAAAFLVAVAGVGQVLLASPAMNPLSTHLEFHNNHH